MDTHDAEKPDAPVLADGGPVVLVTSKHAGSAGRGPDPAEALTRAGIRVGLALPVDALDDLSPQGSVWRDAGFAAAIAAGGDGTVGAVATHLAGSGLPLGILPCGTANDVVRSLFLPTDVDEACRALVQSVPHPLDTGRVLPALTEPRASGVDAHADATDARRRPMPEDGAHFLHALTLGFNVEFARLATDVARRQRFGRLTYAASVLEAVQSYKPLRMRLIFDDPAEGTPDEVETLAAQVTIVNTPVFGGGMNLRIADVRSDDGLLDVVVIEAMDMDKLRAVVESALTALGRLTEGLRDGTPWAVRQRRDDDPADAQASDLLPLALPGIRRYKAHGVTIRPETSVDVTLDGELRAHTPVHVAAEHAAISVLLSADARQRLLEFEGRA